MNDNSPVVEGAEERTVVPFYGNPKAKARRDARTETARAHPTRNGVRGQRKGVDFKSTLRLNDVQREAIERLDELPDDAMLGGIARIVVMRTLIAVLKGDIAVKTASEAMKVAEISHRIAVGEDGRTEGALAALTPDEKAELLADLTAKAKASAAKSG